MDNIHALHISTQESIPEACVLYFPRLLVGGSEVPSEGTMLFQMEEDTEFVYSTAEVILASTDQQKIVIISPHLEAIRETLKGVMIKTENNETHQDFCRRLNGEAQYFMLERGILDQIGVQRETLRNLFSVFPELENMCDRLNVVQISSGKNKVHVIPNHYSSEVLNASLVPRNGKYYAPAPQKVRFLKVTEEIDGADECVIAAPHGNELKRLMPDAEIVQLPDDHKEDVSLDLPEDVHLYVLQRVRLKAGYIVKNYFEKVFQHETDRALKDFMESV